TGDRVDLGLALLALKRRYRGGLTLNVGLRAGERAFHLRFSPDRLVVRDRPEEHADLELEAREEVLRALFTGGATASSLRAGRRLRVTGAEPAFADLLAALDLGAGAAS